MPASGMRTGGCPSGAKTFPSICPGTQTGPLAAGGGLSKPEPIGGMILKQSGTLIQGIEKEKAKEIIKSIKDSKLKVQAQIMDEMIRVTSKSIDELQATMSHCRSQKFGLPIQFINMRS